MFDISAVKYYGDGSLGDVEISDGVFDLVNCYAAVKSIDELSDSKIILDWENRKAGIYENFQAGNDILIHVSASASETEYLGRYIVAKILLENNSILTLDKPITDLIPRDKFEYYNIQAVTIANFDCLTIKAGGVIRPPIFDPYKYCGGILALRCWDSLTLAGGHIDLSDCGIPSNRKHLLRPLTSQETAANGEGDIARYSGWENFLTAERFLLNAGDGAAFIVAKRLNLEESSRIGNPQTHGAAYCRGAANSVGNKPSNITNIGGSTILICAETIKDFDAKVIAKYRRASTVESEQGRGLCRCYIASQTVLPNDEGLYSYDVIKDKSRLSDVVNVKDYGSGKYGSLTNPKKGLNNYARVVWISRNGCRLKIMNETHDGLARIVEGSKVLVQVIQKNSYERAGEIVLATVLQRNKDYVLIDKGLKVDLEEYGMQIISVPELVNLTISENYTATRQYDGVGGVFAAMVNNVCEISGKLNVEGKGGLAYGREGLKAIGNAQNATKLPLGEGHGSIFLVAKKLILSENSRLGASYSGAGENNRLGGSNATLSNIGGGYSGAYDEEGTGSGGGYNGGGAAASGKVGGMGGSGAHGGTSAGTTFERSKEVGGYGSNGGGKQGAHIFLVAGEIENFNISAISTGGSGGGLNGAAGYGGGAGSISGGSSGWCFIYV